MFDAGLIITLVGMLGVFVFLIVLVLSMGLMSSFITKFLPEKEVSAPIKAKPTVEVEIAVAIAAIKSLSAKENN